MNRTHSERITQRVFTGLGGLANRRLWRRQDHKGIWRYYIRNLR